MQRQERMSSVEEEETDHTNKNKVTPIKSWLKKHLDTVNPAPVSKPVYIIPQEPEERPDILSSDGNRSSSEDEDQPRRVKKSPKPRGRPPIRHSTSIGEEDRRSVLPTPSPPQAIPVATVCPPQQQRSSPSGNSDENSINNSYSWSAAA